MYLLLTLFIVVSNVSISSSFSALFTSFSDFLKLTFDFFSFRLLVGFWLFRFPILRASLSSSRSFVLEFQVLLFRVLGALSGVPAVYGQFQYFLISCSSLVLRF